MKIRFLFVSFQDFDARKVVLILFTMVDEEHFQLKLSHQKPVTFLGKAGSSKIHLCFLVISSLFHLVCLVLQYLRVL
jgi:hypothetical protein